MSETKNHLEIPHETRRQLADIAGRLSSLNTGTTGDVFWLATSEPSGGYEWSQYDLGINKDGHLVECHQSGCSCNSPEDPTPDGSFSLDTPIFLDSGEYWGTEVQEAVTELVVVTETLYKVLNHADVSPQEIIALPNAEIRRAVVELVGYEKIVEGATILDESDKDGTLLKIDLEDDEPLMLLHVKDPSTAREYFLRVPPTVTTSRQARAFGFEVEPDEFEPLIET